MGVLEAMALLLWVPRQALLPLALVGLPIGLALGVLEAVYLALLSGTVSQGKLMGAVLAYRALYYLLPLAVATVGYVAMELRARRTATTGG